jgi:galactokinase
VLLIHSGVERALGDSAYADRVAECGAALTGLRQLVPGIQLLAEATEADVRIAPMSDRARKRALHVVGEVARVRAAVAAMLAGQPMPGALLGETHASLRDLFECSTPDLDFLAEAASAMAGVRGARLCGAGWGGCVLVLGDAAALPDVATRVAAAYERRTGQVPRTWISTAGGGVSLDLVHV